MLAGMMNKNEEKREEEAAAIRKKTKKGLMGMPGVGLPGGPQAGLPLKTSLKELNETVDELE
jgi:hypothetical protein